MSVIRAFLSIAEKKHQFFQFFNIKCISYEAHIHSCQHYGTFLEPSDCPGKGPIILLGFYFILNAKKLCLVIHYIKISITI